MKRITHILLALTAIIAVSCSKHDTERPEQLDSYIFFEAGVMDVVETKVDLLTGESLPAEDGTAFGVVGFYEGGEYIFDGYDDKIAKVYRNDGAFQYDHLAPWMGTLHTFHAFYPYSDLNSNVKVGTGNIPYIDYTQPSTPDAMIDILGTCEQFTNNASYTPVELTFKHLLWAFNIEIKNSQTEEITTPTTSIQNPDLKIRKVTFTVSGFPEKVSLMLNSGLTCTTNSIFESPQSYVIYSSDEGQTISKDKSQKYGPLLFVPVAASTGLHYKVTIEYTTEGGSDDTYVYPSTGYKTVQSAFTRGNVYSLTINKTNDKFFIGSIYEDGYWDDFGENIDHEFN